MEAPPKPSMRQDTLRFGTGTQANTATKRKPTTATPDDLDERLKRHRFAMSRPTHGPNRYVRGDTPDPSSTSEVSPTPSSTLQIRESTGDIFAAPPNTLLIHACNCEGSWGAGIAKAFKDRYPAAYEVYAAHCKKKQNDELFRTALLIPPPSTDVDGHFVGCLFTSRAYGRKKDSPARILAATGPAMEDLLTQVRDWNAKADDGMKVGEVRMCKINSGLFNVPWAKTRAVLEEIEVGDDEGGVELIEVIDRE